MLYNSCSQSVVRIPLRIRDGAVGGHSKIILIMAENIKIKGVKIKTQKRSYGVLVCKGRLT
jgi:hypothetical protein